MSILAEDYRNRADALRVWWEKSYEKIKGLPPASISTDGGMLEWDGDLLKVDGRVPSGYRASLSATIQDLLTIAKHLDRLVGAAESHALYEIVQIDAILAMETDRQPHHD